MSRSGADASNPRGGQPARAFRAPLLDASDVDTVVDGSGSSIVASTGLGGTRSTNAGERPIGFALAAAGARLGGIGLPMSATGLDGFGMASGGFRFNSNGSSSMASPGQRFCGTDQPSSRGWLSVSGPASSSTFPEGLFPTYVDPGLFQGAGGHATTGMWPGLFQGAGGHATTGMWSGGPGFTEFMGSAIAGLGPSSYSSQLNASAFFPRTFATEVNIDKGPSHASSARSGGVWRQAASALDIVETEPAQGKQESVKGNELKRQQHLKISWTSLRAVAWPIGARKTLGYFVKFVLMK